jgi:hypothetical protein
MSSPTTPQELLEIAEREAGTEAMQTLVEGHLSMLMDLRENLAIDDIELLSANIGTNKRVDKAVKDKVASLQGKMRVLIQEVASRIENQKCKSSEEAIQALRLSRTERIRAAALLTADKHLHISCQSLKVAVELLCGLNKEIVSRLGSATDMGPDEERKLVLGNALLVCELTDFAIRYIEGFSLQGVDEIEVIYKEMQKTRSNLRDEAKSLRNQATAPDIDESVRQQVLQDITTRDEAVNVLEQEWSSYMESIKSRDGEIGAIRKRLPNLRLLRDNAKAQINTLEAVAVLQLVQRNTRAIEATVSQLEDIQLASLSADRVRRLLKI